MKNESTMDTLKRVSLQAAHAERVQDMRDGRRLRAQTFASGREYRRRSKHRTDWRD